MEKKILESCIELNIDYLEPLQQETLSETKERFKKMKNKIKYQKIKLKKVKKSQMSKTVTNKDTRSNPDPQQQEATAEPVSDVGEQSMSQMDVQTDCVSSPTVPSQSGNLINSLQPNPEVGQSVIDFLDGEKNHDVATCVVCRETRTAYKPSYPLTMIKLV